MVIKSSSAFLATTLLASSALAWESTTTAPVDPTDAPWLDWESSTTTTTKPVAKTTTSADPWLDWASTTTTTTKPVVKATTTVDPWLDWSSTTTTTKPVVKATTTVDPWLDWASTTTKPVSPATTSATHVWDDWTSAQPVDPAVCKVVTVTYTGVGFWVPDPAATWGDWPVAPATTTTTTKPVVKTTTTVDPTWSDWVSYTTTTTKPVVPTTTAVDPSWTDWVETTTSKPVTTVKPTTTKAATTTTTKAPAPKATCNADNGKTVLAGGSCGCGFEVNCGVRASPDAKSKFWEQTEGQIVPTLAECLALCDNNSKCEAALWVDDATNGDYHKCWQISGLGAPTGSGVAQISYKKSCNGQCSYSYGQ